MSEISLKWFFQIPGLFITIGVLLILIAILVLIIGSSKARKNKKDDLSLVDDNDSDVTVAEESPVDVTLSNDSVNHLNIVSDINNVSNNNLQEESVNTVNPTITVTNDIAQLPVNDNNDSLEKVVNTPQPVSINEPIVTPLENIEVSATVPSNDVPPLIDPNLIGQESLVKEEAMMETAVPQDLEQHITESVTKDNSDTIMKEEPTIAPIFAEPVSNNQEVVGPLLTELEEPVAMSIDMASDNMKPLEANVVTNSTEEPIKQNIVFDNATMITPSVTNDVVSNNLVVENNEIEEIL